MKGIEGYYSLIQYCPDRFRAEGANVGVLLFTPQTPALRARVTEFGRHARKMFHLDAAETLRVCRASRAIADRVEHSQDEILTVEDLQHFIDTRANDIRITSPRLVKVENVDADLERLFADLVEREPQDHVAVAAVVSPSVLDSTFARLIASNRATGPREVVVPVRGTTLAVPYAYQNGVLNLVKPEKFSKSLDKAMDKASVLAIAGDSLQTTPEDGEARQLVVVSEGKSTPRRRETEARLSELFERYHVRFVSSKHIKEFAAEVETSAH